MKTHGKRQWAMVRRVIGPKFHGRWQWVILLAMIGPSLLVALVLKIMNWLR